MNVEEVKNIHFFLADHYASTDDPISPPGVKDHGLLESACARPNMTACQKEMFETQFDKAAALFHSIISNHCFHNGNKRTALLSTLYFLSLNNYWVEGCSDDELFEFTRKTAAHEICPNRDDEISCISKWFSEHSRKVVKGDKNLKFNDLKEVLAQFDFELIDDGFTCSIKKDGEEVEKIIKRGKQGHNDYDPAYIAGLRKKLDLTPEKGIDSARFYGQRGIDIQLNDLMQLRIDVFNRLART
ncbi:type II toxin-antitoxin system death-on-curing family toxin [Desulfovibrio desulfuricans]|uniref:Type II toxin-antitoxin system death-on-curing family toxin n=1 Tax=Desulfovibrio desulfuricans TaxID=876 RepID=A0A4P7UQB8_DESDE|nr:type II toxin-antitoxin system death-on-curing family toxin [Desulfovibrio desulfuricans]QCC85782.1 type II toxin-antitoxin system death-on-curing family toxin [Desulfovibrio desulfuricans]